jgi:hypothetical protein
MRQSARVLAAFVFLLLAACSATDFRSPIQAFDQAVTEGGRVVDAYGQERAEANFALRRAVIAQRADQVVVRGSDCRPGAAAAGCVARTGPQRTPIGIGQPAARPAELAAALNRYADGLALVAAATTEADFDRAVGRLSDALRGLAGVVPQAAGAAALAEPGAGVLSNIGGLVLQQRRFALLRDAINAADPAVQMAATELAAVVGGQREAAADDRAALIARLAALYNAIEPRPGIEGAAAAAGREALLTRLSDLTVAQRRLLGDDPVADLRGLGEAHAALRKGVNDPTPPIAQLTEDLKRLADRLRRAADAATRLPLG